MKRTLSAMDARQHFGEMLEGVFYRGDEVVIERAGKSMAVVVSLDRYESMQRSRERFLQLIEKSQKHNQGVPSEVLDEDISKAIKEVRGAKRSSASARR